MKLLKKILLCLWWLVILAGLIFAVMFIMRENKIREYSSYYWDHIREILWGDIGNVVMTNATVYSDYINFTWTVSYNWSTYNYDCDVYSKDGVLCDTRIDRDNPDDEFDDDTLSFDEFRNFLTQEPMELSYEFTDEEAASYWWKFLDDSECYMLGGFKDNNPDKDLQGRNINCYNESWMEEWLHIINGLSMFGFMDFDNYTDWKRNWTHISLHTNWQRASQWTYIDWEIEWDWFVYEKDWSLKRVIHYKNGEEVGEDTASDE